MFLVPDSIVIQRGTVLDHNSCYRPHGSGCPTGPLPLSNPHVSVVLEKIKVQLAVAMRRSNGPGCNMQTDTRHSSVVLMSPCIQWHRQSPEWSHLTHNTWCPRRRDRYGYRAQTQSCTYYAPTESGSRQHIQHCTHIQFQKRWFKWLI